MLSFGKNSDTDRDSFLVVAGALTTGDGRWLLQRRPLDKHHGGLWEFPGGKVEASEIPVKALTRELKEELDIEVSDVNCDPAIFAQTPPSEADTHIVILLYTIVKWAGSPRSIEGGETGWFTPSEMKALPKPPLDQDLCKRLFGPNDV